MLGTLTKDISDRLTCKHLQVKQSQLHDANIRISGYRHSSNLLLCAAIITSSSTITLHNVPKLLDTSVMIKILDELGASCLHQDDVLTVNTSKLSKYEVSNHLSKQLHGSIYLMPALLGRWGKCIFGKSGGCQIGEKKQGFERPIHHILDVMKKFGAKINFIQNMIESEVVNLTPLTIDIMDYSSSKTEIIGPLTSGATKTAILLAIAVKKGKTVITNPFLKSETRDLLDFIKDLGYNVFYNSKKIEISYGKQKSHFKHHVISDPSEIITYMSIAGFHKVQLLLSDITLDRT